MAITRQARHPPRASRLRIRTRSRPERIPLHHPLKRNEEERLLAARAEGGEGHMTWRALSRNRKQQGQGMVEYALILVLVSIVVIVILLTMGNQILNVFSNVVAALG
jgi:pilus assembly protein Flp/PilA